MASVSARWLFGGWLLLLAVVLVWNWCAGRLNRETDEASQAYLDDVLAKDRAVIDELEAWEGN